MSNGTTAPATASEAEQRFFKRYGEQTGTTWASVQGFLGKSVNKPTTVDGWIQIAEQVRDAIQIESFMDQPRHTTPAPTTAEPDTLGRIADALERIAAALERQPAPMAAAPKASSGDGVRWGDDGIPICVKHDRRMKVSQYGGYFCTAPDDSTNNGKCKVKVKE